MPIYEYRCSDCGEDFQAIRRISDATLPECKACGSDQVAKKISLSAFHLKGTGWYKTDYADKAKGGSGATGSTGKPASNGTNGSESSSASSSDSSSASSSDSSSSSKSSKSSDASAA